MSNFFKNLDKYKNDLKQLISEGEKLLLRMEYECSPDEMKKLSSEALKKITQTQWENLLDSFAKI